MTDDTDVSDLNLDQLLERMKLDELSDAPLITPVNFAKLHSGITPQNVYYYIRNGKLRTVTCPCGRSCVYREEAEALFIERGKIKKGAFE